MCLFFCSTIIHGFEAINFVDCDRYVVFIRHGESKFNNRKIFTGWCDVDLTEKGLKEAFDAGVRLASHGFHFDVAHTSVLKRATKSTHQVLAGLEQTYVPIKTTWSLNERHYGALQGKSKTKMQTQLGSIVTEWRRSYTTKPPEMRDTHPHWLLMKNDVRYRNIVVPRAESLEDTQGRVLKYWHSDIVPDAKAGKAVLVVAHSNTLRALVKAIDGMDDKAIEDLYIPTGAPFVYTFDNNMNSLGQPDQKGFRGLFIGNGKAREDVCVSAYIARKEACEKKFFENPEMVPEECVSPIPDGCDVEPNINHSANSFSLSQYRSIPTEKLQ